MSNTRQRVLDYVTLHIQREHYAPTLAEIGQTLGISAPAADKHVQALIRAGRLKAIRATHKRQGRGLEIGGEDG